MSLSKLIGIVWVLLVSWFLRGWVSTAHVATSWAIVAVGLLYAVVCVLEWLGIVRVTIGAPARRARPAAPAPANNDGTPVV